MSQPSKLSVFFRRLCGRIKKEVKTTYYLCFIPVYRVVRQERRKKYYVLGIPLFSRKRMKNLIAAEVDRCLTNTKLESLANKIMSRHLYNRIENPGASSHILLFDCLCDENVEAIDAWSMYQYLKAENIPAKYVLMRTNKLAESVQDDPDVILVRDEADFFIRCYGSIANACCVLSSFGIHAPYHKFFKRLPFLRCIFIEHGVIYIGSFAMKIYHPTCFHNIVVPSKRTHELYCNKSAWKEEHMLLNGIPRWGLLSRKPHEGKNIFIFFTWRKTFIRKPELAKAYFEKIHSLLSNPAFLKLVKENKLNVNLAFHHSLSYNNVPIPKFDESINIIEMTGISRHIGTTDLMITDYSSICFDFMYLDIPILFYRFDAGNTNLIDADIEIGVEASKLDSSLYNCVYQESDVVKVVENYVRNGFVLEEENVRKNEAFFWKRGEDPRQELYAKLKELGCVPPRFRVHA